MISQKNIEAVKDRIVSILHPEKIILFGSYAKGNPSENSDLDLLIIQKSDLPPYKRVRPAKRLLRGIGFPVDIIVATPDEVEFWKDTPLAFITKIMKEGKQIYG